MSFSYDSDYFPSCDYGYDYSHNFVDFPVYRSIEVEQNFPQELSLAPPPTLFKSKPSSSFDSSFSQITVSVATNTINAESDFDLMEFLNEPKTTSKYGIACVEDLGFSSLSHTTVYFENEDENEEIKSLKMIEMVNQFLNDNQIYNEKNKEAKWICESITQCENIKFQIQIFSTSTGFAVEFLRLRGCSLIFSSLFRKFKSAEVKVVSPSITSITSIASIKNESEKEKEKESIDSLISYLNVNPIEAVKIISALILTISQYSELLTQICRFLIERKEVYCLLTLATHLNHQISNGIDSTTTSLSSTDLLKFYDQLIPSLVKYSFDSSQSSFIRHHSSQLMKERMAMN